MIRQMLNLRKPVYILYLTKVGPGGIIIRELDNGDKVEEHFLVGEEKQNYET